MPYLPPYNDSSSQDPYVGGGDTSTQPFPDPVIIGPSVVTSADGVEACCDCDISCTYDLPVFAYEGDQNDRRKNDYSTFEFAIASGYTVNFKLIKIDIEGTTISTTNITDSTYGKLYTSLKSDIWALQLDWYLVATLIGYGRYKANVTVLNSGASTLISSDTYKFNLKPYSCDAAHRTVKIRSEQSGYFENGLDFSNLSYVGYVPGGQFIGTRTTWSQEIRVNGWFYRSGRTIEQDNVMLSNKGQQQVQAKTIKKYTLKIDHATANITNLILEKMLLSGEFYISDYSTNSIETYNDVRVRPMEYADPIVNRLNINEFQEVELQEWQEDNVIRYK